MPRYLAVALLLVTASAGADTRFVSLLELATRCDLVVHGTVLEVGDTTATIDVAKALKRDLAAPRIVVTPTTYRGCGCAVTSFAVGEEVVVFLSLLPDGRFEVMCGGQGKVAIRRDVRIADVVEAATRLVEAANLDDEARDRAMIELAASDNATLRSEARLYISGRKDLARYRADLVALLDGRFPETRAAGLRGLRNVDAPEAIDRMIALTEDPDPSVILVASQALSRYDTAETVAALVRLTRHEHKSVRYRAINDLGASRRLDALEALLRLLDDADPKARELTCSRLVWWLRATREGSFAARLAVLLYDGAPAPARREASKTAREPKSPALVEPLVRVLRDATPGGPVEAASLESLRQIQRYGGENGKRGVEAHLDLILRSLRRGTGGTAPVEIFAAASDLDEVRWAAKEHPDAAVRGLAQRLLARR